MIEPARTDDVSAISAVLAANQGYNVAAHIGDFLVARDDARRVVGCAALQKFSRRLGEILSVAVLPAMQGQGIGAALVHACEQRAADRGLKRVFLMTAKPRYFARLGYRRIALWSLPSRVLLAKLRPVFYQEPSRWWPSLAGRYTFLAKSLNAA